ncbi:hypothetical protein DV706_17990 (plasmid) [Natronorubrum bangense]|uniref:Uncharacterized protein n=2 Tax=Natronorubrum bangense TaxID=61858 RepID=L9WCD2_9EURY|nr:hypothetical protein C494_13911 [Natronorubrum bangense JCM 10635]QCC56418.1 hypothetical protein DV706_17990 [Natronorubrum bangense]
MSDACERTAVTDLARTVRLETNRGVFEWGTPTRARGGRERPLSETDHLEKRRQLFAFADVDLLTTYID